MKFENWQQRYSELCRQRAEREKEELALVYALYRAGETEETLWQKVLEAEGRSWVN
jgi:hypothetical protein